MRKILCLFSFCLFFTSICSGCSYVELENRMRGFPSQKKELDIETNEDGTPEIKVETENDMDKLKLRKTGDAIIVNDGIAELSYTVNSMAVYDNFEKAGLEPTDMGYIYEDYKNNPFVLLDITVKNRKVITKVKDYNIAVFHLLDQKILSDPWKEALPELAYFSAHQGNDSEYFHYTLEQGGEMNCQIGWILYGAVPEAENLIVHVGASINEMNYVGLNGKAP